MAQPYLITGLPVPRGQAPPPRLEIRDLVKQGEQFTLFILAWDRIQQKATDVPDVPAGAHFASLAGIHGLPFQRWPGDPKASSQPAPGTDFGGYCWHGSVGFPTWHRPYVMAVEQSICQAAIKIADQLTANNPSDATKWKTAAQTLRLPYWDWVSPSTGADGFPQLLKQSQLTLVMPGGKTAQHANILEHLTLVDGIPPGFADTTEQEVTGVTETAYYREWNRTYRWPSSTPKNPTQDYDSLDAQLEDPTTGYNGLRSQVAQLFSLPQSGVDPDNYSRIWDNFSNTSFQSDDDTYPYNAGPLEQPHNLIHGYVGGIGHMGDPDYAGFDPVFFLHHCNVDRLFALWEYCYPQYRIGKGYVRDGELVQFTQPGGLWYEPDNAPVDDSTVLEPFRKADGNYWTSVDTYGLTNGAKVQKGYTYAPVNGVQVEQPANDQQRAQALAKIQQYFSLNPQQASRKANNVVRLKAPIFTANPGTDKGLPQGWVPVENHRHFVLRVSLLEHAFDGSYSLIVSHQAANGGVEPVGTVAVFARNLTRQDGQEGGHCAGCHGRRIEGRRVRGLIPIPSTIVAQLVAAGDANHSHASDDTVAQAIASKLTARLVLPNGQPIATPDAPHPGLLVQHPRPQAGGRRFNAAGQALEGNKKPVLSLWSSNAAHPQGRDGPIVDYDWTKHLDVLTGGWTKVSAQ